ncbi:hypothetical protein Z517_03387 [Fonsecaea pedrosoi CBS 271.37]|uniref:Uncharacterized protein n=1 Tax=Fonsecaea pedrosoi CBS 271.37 TaxID=1442368 RepID=A0A0D2GZU1_9EURO|nr:uncharacterized protein Z517_03387 [Fonsecaea pedrosoi CBS 271.37]KIW84140.1 hypothetical protein Z517_03387 [Fonsecaea pedrosoi CBS 271.37]
MSSHNHHHNHPDHHAHSSHQHGPTHDSSVHSPHRHNHANNPNHHPSLQGHSGPGGAGGPTTHDKITTDPTATTMGTITTGQGHNISTAPSATYTSSSDPSTAPHAPSTHKILGDIKGAVHGVTGSLQAATGTVLGQKHMADKGFAKMGEEDARLAAKTGKPPVGTEQRGTVVPPESTSSTSSTGTGAGAAEHGRGLAHDRT